MYTVSFYCENPLIGSSNLLGNRLRVEVWDTDYSGAEPKEVIMAGLTLTRKRLLDLLLTFRSNEPRADAPDGFIDLEMTPMVMDLEDP